MRHNIIRLNPYAIGIYDIQGKYHESNQAFKNLFQAEPPQIITYLTDPLIQNLNIQKIIEQLSQGQMVRIPGNIL